MSIEDEFTPYSGSSIGVELANAGIARMVYEGLIDAGVGQRARILARLLSGTTVSGGHLARELGISRAAVHKHVDTLRARGIAIRSVPGSGYSLAGPLDSLLPEAVLPRLLARVRRGSHGPLAESLGGGRAATGDRPVFGLPYHYEAKIHSTNERLGELAVRGAPAGTTLATDAQTGGRGRLGRSWVSAAGKDLTFSVLLRPDLPPGDTWLLVLSTAVAAAQTLAGLPGMSERVSVKWPNDILVDGLKVCGILGEASLDMDRVHHLIIGVGLNVNSHVDEIRGHLRPEPALPPTSLLSSAGRRFDRGLLLAAVLAEMERWVDAVEAGEQEELMRAFAARDALLGKPVSVTSGPRSERLIAQGTAAGIGPAGELLVTDEIGATVRVSAGDVTVRPPGRAAPAAGAERRQGRAGQAGASRRVGGRRCKP